MKSVRRWLIALVGLALLVGCAGVPTSGPVRKVTANPARINPGVEIAPAPPGLDATPTEAVEGFLHAMAAYQPDYSVARAYLTPAASDAWRPDEGVSIYSEGYSVAVSERGAVLEAPLLARLSPDGSLTQASGTIRHDFGLVQDDHGQWRISNPPAGLLVSQYLFTSAFARYSVYFWVAGQRWLVPDLRYFRRGAQSPLEAARAVLAGPSQWLTPGVSPAPPGLSVDDVFVTGSGVAVITLGRGKAQLDQVQQAAIAVQMVWTFRQFPAVNSISLRYAGGEAWMVPESSSGVVPTSAYSAMDPVELNTSHQLFAISQGRVVRIGEGTQSAELKDAGVPLAEALSVAVRADANQAAVVVGDRLSLVSLADGEVKEILKRGGLGHPSYSRLGELWVPDSSETVRVYQNEKWASASLEGVSGARIVSVRVSPEGIRAVLVIKDPTGRQRAGMVLVNRAGGELKLDSWRPLFVAAPQAQPEPDVLDVGWSSTNELTILTSDGAGTGVIAMGADGSAPTSMGYVSGSSLVELAVAPDVPLVVRSVSGQVFHYYADYRWSLLASNVTGIEYPT